MSKFFKTFNKVLCQVCTIISTVVLTYCILTFYGLMNNWYSILILAGVPAVISAITLGSINRWELTTRKCWKIAYAITLAGIALLFLTVLEPTFPFRAVGFSLFILLVGLPADMFINREKSVGFFETFGTLSLWDFLTDLVISAVSGYIVALNWSNKLIVIITLLITYAIIVLWNFSIGSKGPKREKSKGKDNISKSKSNKEKTNHNANNLE